MMKSSAKKILAFVLLLTLVISGSLIFLLSGKHSCTNPFPMWLEIPAGEDLECPEYAQLKYAGCSFDAAAEEEQAALQIECTLTQTTQKWTKNFYILYREGEESRWHIVFATARPVQLVSITDLPGTETLECAVPRKLFSHKGIYKIGFPERGTCELPRERLWDGPDEKCGQSGDFPTESGFPMYQDSKLAGPPETNPGTELTVTELVKGNESDTLKLTVNVQENTVVDTGSYHVLFCPQKGDGLYIVYRPAETFFHDFSIETNYRELASGLNTLEYSVPKGLFQQEGVYYLVCALGGFKLF